MPATAPTWTDERLELLKSHFEAGLTCREIAGDIGVSRNAVIGKLSRLNLTREKSSDAPRPARKQAAKGKAPEIGAEAAIPDAAGGVRRARGQRRADPQRTLLFAARIEQGKMPLADQHPGRRGFLFLRQHAGRRPALLRGPHQARLPARARASASRGGEGRGIRPSIMLNAACMAGSCPWTVSKSSSNERGH